MPFDDAEWFITEAGPAYLVTQRNGIGHFEDFGNEQHVVKYIASDAVAPA